MIVFDSNEANKQSKKEVHPTDYVRDIIEKYGVQTAEADIEGDANMIGYGQTPNDYDKLCLSIGAEIKMMPSDLLASVSDGRLMEQLPRMLKAYQVAYLLLVGDHLKVNWETGKVKQRQRGGWQDSAWHYHHVNSILMKFEDGGGRIRVIPDLDQLAAFLLSTYQRYRKQRKSSEVGKATFQKKRRQVSDWNLLDNKLAEFYERMGIGIQRAIVLSEYFPVVETLMYANMDILKRLPVNGRKFGKANAAKVVTWMHENHGTGVDGAARIIR